MGAAAAGVLIIGAGHAGFQCADSLRRMGYDGAVTLIEAEDAIPYQRPPLSKGHLLDGAGESALWFRAESWYEDQRIRLKTGCRVERIDVDAKQVQLNNGEWLAYRWLVLAPGSRLRTLTVPGAELEGVCYVKSLADIRRVEAQLPDAEQVVIIGSSFIALEFAATARKLGKQVTLLARGQRLMNQSVDEQLANYMLEQHRQAGVDIRFGSQPELIEGSAIESPIQSASVTAVVLKSGERLPAQLVVAGIGVEMDTQLAHTAGLNCGGDTAAKPQGILVDRHCQTSQPDVFAAGDLAVAPCPWLPLQADGSLTLKRLESVQNAVDQAKLIAEVIIKKEQGTDGSLPEYRAVPWFWSDQYDIKLQMAGLFDGYDQCVTRGDPASGKFALCYLREGKLIAVHTVNKPADHMQARKLIDAGVTPEPALLADDGVKLKSLL